MTKNSEPTRAIDKHEEFQQQSSRVPETVCEKTHGPEDVGGVVFSAPRQHESHVFRQPFRNTMLARDEHPNVAVLRERGALGRNGCTVLPSTIPGAGWGLFATRQFQPGEIICSYEGTHYTEIPADLASDYILELPNGDGYIVGDPDLCFGVFENDARRDELVNTQVRWDKQTRQASIAATIVVEPGEECFLSYGESFWEAFRRQNSGGADRSDSSSDDEQDWYDAWLRGPDASRISPGLTPRLHPSSRASSRLRASAGGNPTNETGRDKQRSRRSRAESTAGSESVVQPQDDGTVSSELVGVDQLLGDEESGVHIQQETVGPPRHDLQWFVGFPRMGRCS